LGVRLNGVDGLVLGEVKALASLTESKE